MAWEPQPYAHADESVNAVLIQESRRAFMLRVYTWMFGALCLTAVSAIVTVASPALSAMVYGNYGFFFILSLGLAIGLSFLAPRLSGGVAAALFLAYATILGMMLSGIFLVFHLGSIASSFFITAGIFGTMSVYAWVTKRDLASWTTFLMMGLIGFILAAVVNLFIQSSMMNFVITCGLIVVFTGLTAWDTQKLLKYHADHGYADGMSFAIVGAMTLYLDFINLFIRILSILGRRR